MATPLTEAGHIPPETTDNEDPFHDPLMLAVAIAFVVVALVIVVLTGMIHWGVEYGTPPWNANSYPPPIVHHW
ncbi:MAG: hypothetical protein HYY76_04820 [Acidobacteria bacterium]|nr:hypothetical protein [Acidobacteriota bacterium]